MRKKRQMYQGYRGYRRRRVYIGPVEIIGILLVAAVAVFMAFRFLNATEDAGKGGISVPAGDVPQVQPGEDGKEPEPHMTTTSGIACTLTEL